MREKRPHPRQEVSLQDAEAKKRKKEIHEAMAALESVNFKLVSLVSKLSKLKEGEKTLPELFPEAQKVLDDILTLSSNYESVLGDALKLSPEELELFLNYWTDKDEEARISLEN